MSAQVLHAPAVPSVFRCESGKWLALSAGQDVPRIGVLAATEDEARAKFRESMARWIANLNAA